MKVSVTLCVALLVLLLAVQGIDAKNQIARKKIKNIQLFRKVQLECTEKCKDSSDTETCINKCISPSCYKQIYSDYKLEPGEVDTRDDQFRECFQKTVSEREKSSASTLQIVFIPLNLFFLVLSMYI